MKKWISMVLVSALLICLSEYVTAGKQSAAETAQTVTASGSSEGASGDAMSSPGSSDEAGKDAMPPMEEWKTAYEAKLDEVYSGKSSRRYTVRDLDGSGAPELIISHGTDLTVYTYEQGIKQVGEYDFETGTIQLLVTDHASYPGILNFWVGGGLEHYGYLSMADQSLHMEELWNEDYSGISKELGKDRDRIEEISEDTALIQESKKAYEAKNELLFQDISRHNEIEMLEGKMLKKPDPVDVISAFENYVNRQVWLCGKDVFIGEQEYLDQAKTVELYYERLEEEYECWDTYKGPCFETYLYFPYDGEERYECFSFIMGADGFESHPTRYHEDCKSVKKGLTYLGTEKFYFNSEYEVEKPEYPITEEKTALIKKIKQQLTEQYLSYDEDDEEDPWDQYEIYILDFAKQDAGTEAVVIQDQKEVSLCGCVTWTVRLENGKFSDEIMDAKYSPTEDWTDPETRKFYQRMMKLSVCNFVIKR